jgi:hypothetical protein
MKKQMQTVLVGIAMAAILITAGCDGFWGKPEDVASFQRGDYQAKTQTGKTYQGMVELSLKAAELSIKKVIEYDPELLDERSPRSIGASKGLQLYELYERADMNKTRGGRTAASVNELTLRDELDKITADYQQAMQEYFITDLSFLDGYDEVTVANGYVFHSDDLAIDPKGVEGILLLNLLKSELAGEDMDAIMNDLQMASSNYGGNATGARGAFVYNVPRWPSGNIYYKWDPNIASVSKSRFISAMDAWLTKVGPGYIKFIEASSAYIDAADNGTAPIVEFTTNTDFLNGALGRSNVGMALSAKCAIQPSLDSPYDVRTPIHELGHTLGLHHEHQRWDRDTYLSYPASSAARLGSTFDKSIIMTGSYYINHTAILVGMYNYIYVPYVSWTIGNTALAKNGTNYFDYNSIMLYSSKQVPGLKFKIAQQDHWRDKDVPVNFSISDGDAATVQLLYW